MCLNSPCAMGERQMLPMQTKTTRIGIDLFGFLSSDFQKRTIPHLATVPGPTQQSFLRRINKYLTH
jgi:hypothetical protein